MKKVEEKVIELLQQFNDTGEISLTEIARLAIANETEEGRLYYMSQGRMVDLGEITDHSVSVNYAGQETTHETVSVITQKDLIRQTTKGGVTYYTEG